MDEVLHSPLSKLVLGVVLAGVVKFLRRDKPLDGLGEELKLLLLPSLLLAGGLLAAGESYQDAATGGLISLATALGLNSTQKPAEDKPAQDG